MDEYFQANRQNWDSWTLQHELSPFYDLAGFRAGKDRLRSIELEELGNVAGKSLLHYFFTQEPERVASEGSYAAPDSGEQSTFYIWNHGLGDVLNALITAGLCIEFLHEFPYAARAKFPSMQRGDDNWWRLTVAPHGIELLWWRLRGAI